MKRLFKISVSKVYIAYLLLLTVFVIGTYSSYAYFTVNKEKKNAIKMITGNLVGELKVDGEVNDKLVVGASETKIFEVEVVNKNNRQARFNFYYKGSLSNNVEAGYVSGDGYNPMVKETGVNLTANGSLGYFLKYQIKVKNNTSGSITIPIGYSVGLDYNDLSLPSNCYLFEEAKSNTAVEALLADYTNDESVQDYDINYTKTDPTAKENKMYVFNHESNKGTQQSDWSSDELKSYRYIGTTPNNYVTFNNETAGWRIIGIETVDNGTGTKEKRIKLVRKDPLPVGENNYLSWDNKGDSPGFGGVAVTSNGSNDWTDARLMMVLNPNYEDDPHAIGGSIYWNRQNGKCPKGNNNGTAVCDFSEVGLLPEAQAMIGNAKWFLGGIGVSFENPEKNYDEIYQNERGEETCTTTGECTQIKKTNWTGRVGLMYPSDYGYATSGGDNIIRSSCSTSLWNWFSGESTECAKNNWMQEKKDQWLITPFASNDSYVSIISYEGGLSEDASAGMYTGAPSEIARPVVYLKASVLYQSGDGSESNPFVFVNDPNIDNEGPVCKFTEHSDNFYDGGTFSIECTDNSGSLANDLTTDSFHLGGESTTNCGPINYDISLSLTKTEDISNGKRYTFTSPSGYEVCYDNYIELKSDAIKDKFGNSNQTSKLEITTSNEKNKDPCSRCAVGSEGEKFD